MHPTDLVDERRERDQLIQAVSSWEKVGSAPPPRDGEHVAVTKFETVWREPRAAEVGATGLRFDVACDPEFSKIRYPV